MQFGSTQKTVTKERKVPYEQQDRKNYTVFFTIITSIGLNNNHDNLQCAVAFREVLRRFFACKMLQSSWPLCKSDYNYLQLQL